MKTIILACVLGFLGGFAGAVGGIKLFEPDTDPGRPMPCHENEQYVWLEYPEEALCLNR